MRDIFAWVTTLWHRLLGDPPFTLIVQQTRKVHECVLLLSPITEALLAENFAAVETLYREIAHTEHAADVIKEDVQNQLARSFLPLRNRAAIRQFIAAQDNIANAVEDYAVVVSLRPIAPPDALHEDCRALVKQVVSVSEHLLNVAEELALLAEASFTGEAVARVLATIDPIGEAESKADALQHTLTRRGYFLADANELSATTLLQLQAYGQTLGAVADAAEQAGKLLRQIIAR